jgi:hypothetical protein
MIWNVKILLAKIKDCKGKELKFPAKKKLPTKIPPNSGEKTFSGLAFQAIFRKKNRELERVF